MTLLKWDTSDWHHSESLRLKQKISTYLSFNSKTFKSYQYQYKMQSEFSGENSLATITRSIEMVFNLIATWTFPLTSKKYAVCVMKEVFKFSLQNTFVSWLCVVRKIKDISLEMFILYFKLFMLKINVHGYYKDYLDSILVWPYK